MTLKHIFAKDIQPYLYDIIQLLGRLEGPNAPLFAEIVLTYILDRSELSDKEAFIELIKSALSPEVGDKIMTIAEQFKAEGRVEGIHAVALNLLEQGLDVEFIAKVTQLRLDEVKHLKETESIH